MGEPALSRADLLELRAELAASFDCVAYVLLPLTERASGARTLTTYPAYTDTGVPSYPCALLRVSDPVEGVTRDQLAAGAVWRVSLPSTAVVPMDAKLTVTGTDVDGVAWVKDALPVLAPATAHTWRVRGKVLVHEPFRSGAP